MEGVINKGLIGKGAFGCVYLVENSLGDQFAIKVMEFLRASISEREVAQNELKVLQELNHEHCLEYVDSFIDGGMMYIITEYCSGGDLSGFLDQIGDTVPEDLLRVWLWQMACGLEYMHTHDTGAVLHRDLKPTNIYLSEVGDIRLGDMGIARMLDRPDAMALTFCGTPPYMSPEALNERPYNTKTDIWSLGCCVVEMATLERAYDASTLFLLRDAVTGKRKPLPSKYSGELDTLVANMMQLNHEDRFSAAEILESPVLKGCDQIKPMKCLEPKKLHLALAFHRMTSPSSTVTKADQTVPTLRESLKNIQVILEDKGEVMTSYRIKVDNRMHGRRQDGDTLTGTQQLQTVLYKPQSSSINKTKKKTPKVPSQTKSSQEPDSSLSVPVLTSMLSTMRVTHGKSPTPQRKEPGPESSRASQMELLKDVVRQTIGETSLLKAQEIVSSAAGREDIMSGLLPLMGEEGSLLSNIVVYLLLMESVTLSSSST